MRSTPFLSRRGLLAGAGALTALALAGCRAAPGAGALSDVTLNIWRYKTTAGNFMEEAGQADTPYKVRYIDLPGGPLVLNAYAAGELDYAYMSEIPPAFAVQSGISLKLIATHQGDVNNSGVLVVKGSSARRFDDLRGRTIAYTPNTNNHYYLLKLLEAHGMTLNDVKAIGLPINDANAAFTRGHVEAMVSSGISALLTESLLGGRWLVRSVKGLYSGNFCISAHPAALADPLKRIAIQDYLRREQATWQWIYRNPDRWADRSGQLSNQPAALFLRLAREASRPGLIVPPDRTAMTNLQQVADDLFKFRLVKGRYDLSRLWDKGLI
ncbi:ABC transporter substrate-binding protein [Sphingobium sp. BYY-5]|uniref:ABC transporter substrate-binding protein n=1 Tax=Sphingobium sp. BYY-5 TaxID=2926400 RepID=UPI001FA776E5|nr:ABC transporter substrate-binding protein [Sphingobium sp. BYY-5]MCI4591780.1 ABC transporter substrate-binding protein [Sphingobium sp. BYY-5]